MATWWTAPAMDRDVGAGSATPSVSISSSVGELKCERTCQLRNKTPPLLGHVWSPLLFSSGFYNRSVSGATNQGVLPDRRVMGQGHSWHPLPLLLLWQRDWRDEMWTSADLPRWEKQSAVYHPPKDAIYLCFSHLYLRIDDVNSVTSGWMVEGLSDCKHHTTSKLMHYVSKKLTSVPRMQIVSEIQIWTHSMTYTVTFMLQILNISKSI